jgi:hypothetical protein
MHDIPDIISFRSNKESADNKTAVYGDLIHASEVLNSVFSNRVDALLFLNERTHGQKRVPHWDVYQQIRAQLNRFVSPLRHLASHIGCDPLLAALYASTDMVDRSYDY